MKSGFVMMRVGLQEHLVAGALSAFDVGVYLILHLQVDFRTGIWTGSAPRLLATAPRGTKLRNMQRALSRLSKIGFIKAFHQHGTRGNYRVLINKYEPTSGALKGKRLNAGRSDSLHTPVYEPCALSDSETDADGVGEAAPYQDVNKNLEEKKWTKNRFASQNSSSPLKKGFKEKPKSYTVPEDIYEQ